MGPLIGNNIPRAKKFPTWGWPSGALARVSRLRCPKASLLRSDRPVQDSSAVHLTRINDELQLKSSQNNLGGDAHGYARRHQSCQQPLATNGSAGRGGSRPNRLGGQVYLVTHKRPPRIGGLFIFPAQCGARRMRIRFEYRSVSFFHSVVTFKQL